MPWSTSLVAKRALVSLLLRLAVAYHVVLAVNRDSGDRLVTAAYKKVILKVHPDSHVLIQVNENDDSGGLWGAPGVPPGRPRPS